MPHTANFNHIAFAYDFTARLVFGRSIQEAQIAFLDLIPAGSRVLIIGGGTGWIIPKLFAASDIRQLVYLEASEQMIHRAKRNAKGVAFHKIQFVNGTQDLLSELGTFDVVLTFFFLDLFPAKELDKIIPQLHLSLRNNGLWMISDFNPNTSTHWQKALVQTMYFLFRLICRIQAKQLVDARPVLMKIGMMLLHEQWHFHSLIFTRVYRKD
jgi:ubiquinone/menaquinone biosynthesis C-methylase UbiE